MGDWAGTRGTYVERPNLEGMAAVGGPDFLLFVASEPGTGVDPFQDVETSMVRRMTGTVAGGWLTRIGGTGSASPGSGASRPEEARPWTLPAPQAQCVRLVMDIAESVQRRVALIDVNNSAGHDDIVRKWVGTDGLLPLLVRPDGARIQGLGEFVPRAVRRFMLGK